MQKYIQALLTTVLLAMSTTTSLVQADSRHYNLDNHQDYEHDPRHDDSQYLRQPEKSNPLKSPITQRGNSYNIPSYQDRRHHDVKVVRPFVPLHNGHVRFYRDDDVYEWLAFSAIAVKLLDNLNEQQQREHEAAQVRASMAPIGQTIYWKNGNASGYMTPTRDGTDHAGRYCREFQHQITIGGQRLQRYSTACRQPGGSWKEISSGQ
jgi:surface antigen